MSQALSLLQTASVDDDAGAIVGCLAFVGPVVAPVLFLIGALVVVRRVLRARGESRPPLDAGTLLRLSLLGLTAAYWAASTGLMSGPGWMSASEYCNARGFPADRITTRTFPLSMRCGPGGELVPSWVNPMLVAGLTLASAALAAAALRAYLGLLSRARLHRDRSVSPFGRLGRR
ncbi:hypothetical protein J2S46_003247 [Kitasatospora herbaricolor]|uniref:hypothetical protein n=1 Tax=Kitasatospora herbaricolor TaxID=68217 RepID=UPI00174E4A51|nr:hypothetical protein [Kitasatospora herbaricolor]MDQ0308691.1 hypothetical protein [Kitasatospora herbaricolor]